MSVFLAYLALLAAGMMALLGDLLSQISFAASFVCGVVCVCVM